MSHKVKEFVKKTIEYPEHKTPTITTSEWVKNVSPNPTQNARTSISYPYFLFRNFYEKCFDLTSLF